MLFSSFTKDLCVLIATPTYAEAQPVARALRLERQSSRSWTNGRVCLKVIGVGPHAVERIPRSRWDRIVVAGLAGGLDPALKVGEVIRPSALLDAEAHRPFRIRGGDGRTLVSVRDTINTAGDKQELYARTRAHAVDMETYAIARVWHHVPGGLEVVRVISDAAEDNLPPAIESWLTSTGQARIPAILHSLVLHPMRLRSTTRFMSRASRAARTLGEVIGDLYGSHTGSPA